MSSIISAGGVAEELYSCVRESWGQCYNYNVSYCSENLFLVCWSSCAGPTNIVYCSDQAS
jgi:hypothetical protein